MMALMALIGDEVLEAYESRLLDIIEPWDVEDERRRELRMLEKERDWKRVVRILADGKKVDWRSCMALSVRVESVVRDDMIDEEK
jgi:hypothetical protein